MLITFWTSCCCLLIIHSSITHLSNSKFEYELIVYLANWVLVLTEERLQFKAFGCGQSSDLSVSGHRHRGRLGEKTVKQPQQRE